DGENIWITSSNTGRLLKLDKDANILQSIDVAPFPRGPVFDGRNIWAPGNGYVAVVDPGMGRVIRAIELRISMDTLGSGNGAAFDGRRVLVTSGNNGLSLFDASTLS